jgi:ABC-type transport system involved in multi-copper enzyme maturation permease subunit
MMDFCRGVWTILKREVRSQFSSPMAYIFIIVFVTMSTALFLFLRGFFLYPTANMVEFFGFIVPVLCVFAPAASMRIWAEDRKENTIEMLLTFPISAPALVLGKFLAAMAFYVAALAGTLMIPVMVAVLGSPDGGPIFSGYLGAVLMGSLFIALGMFVSGFCRDQVTAFVLSFLVCVSASLFGWAPFAVVVEENLGPLGAFLRTMVGMTDHYVPFTRGVIEFADVLYFLAWTALFLFLNGAYLEGRSRPRVHARFAGTVGLALLVGILFNVTIAENSLVRLDVTEDRIHTVSDATREVLRRLKVPVQVQYYVSPRDEMPGELRDLERDVAAKLEELRVAGHGMLQWKAVHMRRANVLMKPEDKEKEDGEEKEESLEERLLDKGVKPFSLRAGGEGQVTTQLVYSSIGVAYHKEGEEIIPQILPGSLPELEYLIMSVVFKLAREKKPAVALVAPYEEIDIPPHIMQMLLRQGQMPPQRDDPYIYLEKLLEHEKFDVHRVKLTKDDKLPDEYDTLAVVNPRSLDDRQKWEINRALHSGKSVFLAVQDHLWDYSIRRNSMSASKRKEAPGVNDLLAEIGLEVDTDTLMDANHRSVKIQRTDNPFAALLGGLDVKLPTHISVQSDSMNPDVSVTGRLDEVFYIWGTRVKLDEDKLAENKLEVTTLFSTSDSAWTVRTGMDLGEQDIVQPEDTNRMPLAVLVTGQFPDVYAGKERPEWPEPPPQRGMPPPPPGDDKPEGPARPVKPAPGKLILVGCAKMFNKSGLSRGNLDFFRNSIDALTLGEELIHIRSKKRIPRTIGTLSGFSRAFWKSMTLGLVSVLVIAAGVLRTVVVRRSRERYRAALAKKSDRTGEGGS